MKYLFEKERENYLPYTSGLVFHSLAGHPPLPVRLASELFLRAYTEWSQRNARPCLLYDPLCGSGATLATLKFRYWNHIGSLVGSDINEASVAVARSNFTLLTPAGLQKRMDKLQEDAAAFGKESHQAALEAAAFLQQQIKGSVDTAVFTADALNLEQIRRGLDQRRVDIAFFDIPYGILSAWEQGDSADRAAVDQVLDNIYDVMNPEGIAAVFTPKGQKIKTPRFERLAKLSVGTRLAWLLRAAA